MSNDILDEGLLPIISPDEGWLSILASDEEMLSISPPVSLPPSQTTIVSSTLSSRRGEHNKESKQARKMAKNRERMREYRRSEKKKKKILQLQVELLTKRLHHQLKIHYANSTEATQTGQYLQNAPTSNRSDLWRVNCMREYMQLVAMSEELRSENEHHEETLYKVWGRYTNFVNLQLLNFYGSTLSPTAPLSVSYRTRSTVIYLPTPPDRIKSKQSKSDGNDQWLSFSFRPNADEDEIDKNTFLFRESMNDVNFRPINDLMCRRLQAEGYEEGVSFTKVMEQEVKSGKYHVINEMDHFGWKVTYYQITTQEAYPNLTHITDLAANEDKTFSDDMVRFDFVKRYTLKPHEDFSSIFTHIREMTWNKLNTPVTSTGLRYSMDNFVGRVVQTINDDTTVIIRSYISKKLPMIFILIFMAHQYKNGVLVSMLNPDHCINRSDEQDRIILKDNNFPIKRNSEVFWVTHGHNRVGWYEMGDRQYEIRFGGTMLLRGYSVDAKILEFSELVANWEKDVFQDPTIPS